MPAAGKPLLNKQNVKEILASGEGVKTVSGEAVAWVEEATRAAAEALAARGKRTPGGKLMPPRTVDELAELGQAGAPAALPSAGDRPLPYAIVEVADGRVEIGSTNIPTTLHIVDRRALEAMAADPAVDDARFAEECALLESLDAMAGHGYRYKGVAAALRAARKKATARKKGSIAMNMLGFAECCGRPPERHSDGSAALCVRCPVCGRHQGLWGDSVACLRRYWNAKFAGPRPETNDRGGMRKIVWPKLHGLPEGWRCADVTMELLSVGSTTRLASHEPMLFFSELDAVGLLMGNDESETYECALGPHRYISKLEIFCRSADHLLSIDWPIRKRYPYSTAHASRWSCTDGTWGLTLHLSAWSAAHRKALDTWWQEEQALKKGP